MRLDESLQVGRRGRWGNLWNLPRNSLCHPVGWGGVVWCGVTAVARPQPGEGHDVRTLLQGGIRQVQGSGRG